MGGIGKTTVAKLVYNQLSQSFDSCCFLSNIRETSQIQGIVCLQNQLLSDILKKEGTYIRNSEEGTQIIRDRLSNKKVLLLLDDVDHKKHMDALVGNRDLFGKGSILIITTRNKEVLKLYGVENLYEVDIMDPQHSLQLFSRHAFRRDDPLDEYINQSKRAVKIAGGLPLALEVIGSLLACTERKEWDKKLNKLENIPDKDVQNKLRISFDALDGREKFIFLDIACLFIGFNKDILSYFWGYEFYPDDAMDVLENMSLIKIEKNSRVRMHDQLRDLGRGEVSAESKWKIENQSRVWNPKKGLDLLRRHKEKTNVEALRLKLDDEKRYLLTYEDFKGLSNLRFLEVDSLQREISLQERHLRNEWASNFLPPNDFQENLNLFPDLQWLSWHDIPPTFNIANFSMKDGVILDLSRSEITDDWKGWSHIKVMKNLKVLDLTSCNCLKKTPIFSACSNLERFILRDCKSLIEIDRLICQLERLVFLDVSACLDLQRLPDKLGGGLASLEYLSLARCWSLKGLPDTIGNLESLIELDMSRTRMQELPDSLGRLKNLKVLKMYDVHTNKIPDAFWMIEKVEEIEIQAFSRDSTSPVIIGDCIYRNRSLRILRLTSVNIYALPPRLPENLIELELYWLFSDKFPDLSNLTNLKVLLLHFDRHHGDDEKRNVAVVEDPIPGWIGNLTKLESLDLSCDFVKTTSPTDVCLPPQLKSVRLSCPNLRCLPRLPPSLSSLRLFYCPSLCSIGDLSNLKNLSNLHIYFAAIVEIQGLDCLENLRDLQLEYLSQVRSLPDIRNLNKLKRLEVLQCKNLVVIQGEYPRSLDSFRIIDCPSLERLPDLSGLMGQQVVEIEGCSKLNVEAFLGYAIAQKNPRDLLIKGFKQLQILPDLSNLKYSNELKHLQILFCDRLVEIQGELPQSLEKLEIYSCESLEKLPDMSNLKGLQEVCIGHCGNLVEIRGKLPQLLVKLEIRSCQSLRELPDMSSLKGLCEVCIGHCGNMVEIRGELPQSLKKLNIDFCKSLRKLPNLSSLMGLHEVHIGECGILVEILGELPQSLEKLEIHACKSLGELPNMSSLKAVREVFIGGCDNLIEVRCELPQSLEKLEIYTCKSLQELPNMSSLKAVREVSIGSCDNLIEVRGELPKFLEKLKIHTCKSLRELPNMSSLKAVREVSIVGCDNLVKIEGELPQSLEALKIFSCEFLQELPALSSSMRLLVVVIDKCRNLVKIQGELPQSLKRLHISFCESLQEFPALSSSMRLQWVVIHKCGNLVKIQGELPQSLKSLSILSCGSLQELPTLSSSMGLLSTIEIKHCGKLDVKAIALLCSEESVEFVGEDRRVRGESESEYEGGDEG